MSIYPRTEILSCGKDGSRRGVFSSLRREVVENQSAAQGSVWVVAGGGLASDAPQVIGADLRVLDVRDPHARGNGPLHDDRFSPTVLDWAVLEPEVGGVGTEYCCREKSLNTSIDELAFEVGTNRWHKG
jgi:hypothetical protein